MSFSPNHQPPTEWRSLDSEQDQTSDQPTFIPLGCIFAHHRGRASFCTFPIQA